MKKQRKARKKKRKFTKKMQIKLIALFAFIILALVGLNIRIAFITAKSGDKYAKQVLSQQRYDSRTIPYRRGEILDRNGNILAKSEKVYNVVLDCYAVNGDADYIEPTIKALVTTLGLDEAEIRDRLTADDSKNSQYEVLKREVTGEEKKAFEEYASPSAEERSKMSKEGKAERDNVKGVWFEEDYLRTYPMSTLASNVLGYSNKVNTGVCGLESYYSDVLNGVNGREYGYLNEDSELERTVIEPEHGKTLVSTIDINVQEVVEKYIKEFDEEHPTSPDSELKGKGSKNTAVIIGNPNTGEIYAMATNHGFDLNDPQNTSAWYTDEEVAAMSEEEKSEALNDMWSNFCVSESFEPGSTYKPMTVSSALETGALKGDETFYCDGGEFVTDTQINCDNIYGHGTETIYDAIKNSCNDALMQIGYKLGKADFCRYQRMFNFGKKTGIDLPNESTGVLYDEENMHEVELATNTFGQGFTCTMAQEWAAFSSVVNGGYYYQPHLVKQILDGTGGVAKNIDPLLLQQPISARSSAFLKKALEMGVQEGTGRKAQVPGYRVGGKTGTAEKINPENGQRWAGKYLVSFIGAVPINDPQIVIYVVVDEPNVEDQSTGGYAQIIARKIMQEILPYLNLYPTEEITDEQLMLLGITREEAEAGRKTDSETPETDENGNVIETAETDENGNPITTGETDANGNPITTGETDANGNPITTGETDANGNPITTGETDASENPVTTPESASTDSSTAQEESAADNPNIAAPPENSTQTSESTAEDNGVTDEELGIE